MQFHHTGLFISFDKSMILLRFVRSLIQIEYNLLVCCGPKNAQNDCEIILQHISNGKSSDIRSAKETLMKYINILECSRAAGMTSRTLKCGESSNVTPIRVGNNKAKINNKLPETTVGKTPNLEVINLVSEETFNESDCIILDDSDVNETKESKDELGKLSDNDLFFVDKSLSSFECSQNVGAKRKKSKIRKQTKHRKLNNIEDVKQKATLNPVKSKDILKEPNGQNNIVDISNSFVEENILGASNSKPSSTRKLCSNFNTIDLSSDCSDDDDIVVVDEKLNKDVILLSSQKSPVHSKEHLQVTIHDKCPKISCNSSTVVHTSTSSQPTNSKSKKKKKLPKILNQCNVNKKKKKGKSKWEPLAHLSPTLTKRPSDVPSLFTKNNVGSNVYNPNKTENKNEGLRPIVIDGSNVAIRHGNGTFSVRGLQICVDYFLKRGHRLIKVFVPQFRINQSNFDEITRMETSGILIITPSRRVDGKIIVPYDDRYIIQYAAETNGVVVSTDNYRDLLSENPAWRETIEQRLLMFTWVDDLLMFPQDPLGRNGPTLDEFLRY